MSETSPAGAGDRFTLRSSSLQNRRRRRFVAETLERRTLLNGAHDSSLVQAVQAGLSNSNVNGLAAWTSKLSDPSALGQQLALIGSNLASSYNLQNVLNPILSRLNSAYTTVTDLQNALEGAAGLADGLAVNAVRNLTDNIEFDLELKSTNTTSVALPTGHDTQGPDNLPFNMPFDLGGNLQLSATLDMHATLGAYWDGTSSQAVFYIYAPSTHMSVQASVSATNLNATAHLGFMDVSITNGQVSFSPQFSMSMNDPNPGTDNGRVTLSVLNSTPVSSLIQTGVTGGGPSLSATLSTSLLPGTFPVSFNWASITSPEQVTNNLSSFANFDSLINLDPSKISGGLDTMVSLLATEASNAASGSKLLNAKLPLLNQSLSQIINFPQFFSNTLTHYTDVTSNSSGSTIPFSTAGQLVSLLQSLPGVGPGNISQVLNGTDLQFHLHLGGNISQSYPLNLSLGSNLNLANLSTNGQVTANLSTTTDVTFGLDTSSGNFYMLSSAQAGKPLFTAAANVSTTLNADASLGFLGVHITNGTASLSNAGVTVNLTDPNTSNSTGIITSDELTTTSIPSLLSAAVTGSASLSLPLSTTLASLSSNAGTLSATWSNITDPSTLSVDTSQIQSFFNFNSITPQMVLQGLAAIPGFLNALAGTSGLGKNLAFIGSNLSSIITLGNQFQNYVNSLSNVTTVQGLQQTLQNLVGNAVTVNVTGSNIQFGVQFKQTLNNSISYQFNTNKNLNSGGSSNSPVSFALGGSLNVTGSVQANLGFGLTFGATPSFYLVPGTASSFSANLSIHATNINASGTLAFITVGIQNGTATVSSKASQSNPASLGLQLQDVDHNGMISLTDLTSNLAGVLGPLTVDGAVSVILPITGLPAPGSSPQIMLTWSDISDLSSLTVTPQGLGDLSSVLNFNASTILSGIQALLNMIQGWKNNPILNTNIPLINQPVSALFPWADKAIAFFQQVKNQGNTSTPAAFDTVVNDALNAAGLSQLATLTDKSSNPSAGLFDFLLKFNYSPTITPLAFKFGAGTPLNLSLSLQPALQFTANLEFGFNPTDGFFLMDQGSSAGPEVQLNASLNVPVTALGTFGPISMGVYNGNANIQFGASIDLKAPDSSNKITGTQLAQNLTSVVVPNLTGNAHLTLPLGFYIGGGSPTDPGDGPGVYTTFTASWDASNPGTFLFGSGNSTDPTQGFSDIYLDPGQFVKSIIQPVVQNIQKYDPIPKQLVDFLNNPLPLINKSPAQILGDLSGYPIGTLVGIVQTVQTVANDLAALPGQGNSAIDLSQFFGSSGALSPAVSDPNATASHNGSTPSILQPIVDDLQKVFINVPILSDPAGTIIKMLMGQNVTLVDFHPGHVELNIPFSTPQITIPIFSIGIADADVTAQIGGSVGIFANIDIGLDTRGLINQQISPGDGGPGANFPKVLDGFYIGDTDRFQFGFTGSVYLNLGGQVSVFGFPIVNVYGQIGLKLDLGAHINDVAYQSGTSHPLPFPNGEVDYGKPGGDGKVHLDELYYLWNTYGALCTIDPGGTLSLIGGIGFKALCLPSFFGGDICVLNLFYPMPAQPLIDYNYPCEFKATNLAQIVGNSLVMNPDSSTSNKQISVSVINDSNNKPELQIVESDGGTGLTYQDFYLSDLSAAGVNTLSVVGNGGNDVFNINPNTFQDAATGANPLQYLQIHAGDGNNKIDLSAFKGTSGLHLLGTTITGGNGNDTISGTPGPNLVTVGNGANLITLLDGNDTVTAGGGNDTVNLGNGNDSVTTGDGNSLIAGGSGNDTFHVGNGQNTVNASGGNDTFTAGDGGDQIYNSGGNNLVTTGAGADIIRIDGNGNNSVIAGAGNDQVNVGGSGNNTVHGGAGDDGIFVGDGINFVYGEAGNDQIIAGNGPNYLDGGTGNDSIRAGNGNNTIIDGPSLPGGSATDNNTVVAGDGNDTVFGAWGNDQVTLGNGNDLVYLQNGNNTVLSGGGKDYITAGNGNNVLNSGNGDNRIIAGNGNNQVTTGTGQDVIQLGSGNNTVGSGAGDDSIFVGPGANNIDGGPGNDVLSVTGSNSYVLTNTSLTAASGAGTLANVERISLTGANANNTFDVSGWTHGGVILNGAGPVNTVVSNDQAGFTLTDSNLTRTDGGSFALNNITQAQLTGANTTGISGSPYDTNFDVSYFTGHATLTGGSGPEDYNTVVSSTPGAYTLTDTSLTKTGGGTFALANINHASLPSGAGSSVNSTGFSGVLSLIGGASSGPTLPTGGNSTGPWSEFGQSASNGGVSSSPKAAVESAVAASATGQFVAWADNRSGTYQIYVAEHTASAWVQLAGSAQAGGISNIAGNSRRPAITVDASGNPIVAWTVSNGSSTDIDVATYDPTANGGAGGWVALGTSLGAGGISQTGAADNAQIAMTSSGPVVAWLDTSSGGVANVFAKEFNGTTWVTLGGVAKVTSSAQAVPAFSLAAAGTNVAVAWTQAVSSTAQIYLLQSSGGGAWGAVSASASGNGVSNSSGAAAQPSVAYHSGFLYVAWQDTVNGQSNIAAASNSGGTWGRLVIDTPPSAGNLITRGAASMPKLAENGGVLTLLWAENRIPGQLAQSTELFANRYVAGAFAQVLPGQAAFGGVDQTSVALGSLGLAADPSGHPYVAWGDESSGSPQVYLRGDQFNGKVYFVAPTTRSTDDTLTTAAGSPANSGTAAASPLDSVQSVFSKYTLNPGDAIVVDSGTYSGFTVPSASNGFVIVGNADVLPTFTSPVILNGSQNIILQDLNFSGGLSLTNETNDEIVYDAGGAYTLRGGSGVRIEHGNFGSLTLLAPTNPVILNNTITGQVAIPLTVATGAVNLLMTGNSIGGGLALNDPASGTISANDISGSGTVLDLSATFTGSIDHNNIHGGAIGVNYATGELLNANSIFGNAIGVKDTVNSITTGLGFVVGSIGNNIYNNTTGVQLAGTMVLQHVYGNVTGVAGSGVLGGTDFSTQNLIETNGVGANFAGTIQYNRIDRNLTGVLATNVDVIIHNLIYRNVNYGVETAGAADVRIVNNTFYSTSGNNIQVDGSSSNVQVLNNILWATGGYDLYLTDNSHTGFFSDYNDLYTTGTGTIAHYFKDFGDILDWQQDVYQFDLHSIGTTVINPTWAQPRFANLAADNYQINDLTNGQRASSPTIDSGNPITDVGVPSTQINLLPNPGFDSGTTGWTISPHGTTGSSNPAPFTGSADFVAPGDAAAFATQTINLAAAGVNLSTLQNDVVLFGGRIRWNTNQAGDTAFVQITFLDSGNNAIGSPVVAQASNTTTRWELVGSRQNIPAGTQSIRFRFEADRASGTNDSAFDGAFLYVVPSTYGPDQGAYGDTLTPPDAANAVTHIALRWPDLYTNWDLGAPHTILWESFNNTAQLPVKIDLYQNGQFLLNITPSTPDNGQFTWIPQYSGLSAGTFGLNIHVSLVGQPQVADVGTEAFAIPQAGTSFYVNVTTDSGGDFTTAAGNNRNTGKLASAPLPLLSTTLRTFAMGVGDTVYVDTGTYNDFNPIVIDGARDASVTITGPTNTAHVASLSRAYVGSAGPVIEVTDGATAVQIAHFTLMGSQRGIWVHNGSTRFQASYITTSNNTLEGVRLESDANTSSLDHIIVSYSGNADGIYIGSSSTSLTNISSTNNYDNGITVNGPSDTVNNSQVSNNRQYGIYLSGGGETVSGNTVYSNVSTGIYLSGSGASSLISGNTVYQNSLGISSSNAAVTNNTVYGNSTIGIALGSGTASGNTAYSNPFGLMDNGGAASGNILHDNSIAGALFYGGTLSSSQIYSNPIGIQVGYNYSNNTGYYGGGGNGTLQNNLIYNAGTYGILAYTAGLSILNNTIYQATGNAVQIAGGSTNVVLNNNILWSASGYDIIVPSSSQSGFASDYNDLYVTGTGEVANWQSADYPSWASWFRQLGFDAHGISADPQFTNLAGNNFTLKSTSPAVDAGDLTSYYLQEPLPNGGRINLGAYGNTAQATQSPVQQIQVLIPKNLDQVSVGTATTVTWRSSGLTTSYPIALLDAGGPTVDNFLADAYRAPGSNQISFTHAVDTSAVSNPAPQQVYQTVAYASGGTGNELAYQLPVPDGTYTLKLEFAEGFLSSAGQRLFDIKLNGTVVQANFDVFAAAGAQYKAVEKTFTVVASGGSGVKVELVNDTSGNSAELSGLELFAANPLGTANPKVDLQLSTDGGSTWNTIATALTMDPYGRGSYAWTPTAQQASSNALLKVVSDDFTNISGTSAPFSVGSGNDYYVSPSGSNANDGRSLATPMASLAALLAAYPTISTGATVHVASGTYNLASNVLIGSSHSGLTIVGPADQSALLNRGNTASGSYVFDLQGAAGVTIQNLTITGGQYGIHTNLPSGANTANGSPGLQVLNCIVYGNTAEGIYVDSYSPNATISGNTVYGQTSGTNYQSIDIEVDSANSTVRSNTAHDSSNYAIYSSNAPGIQILNNTASNSNFGIYISGNNSSPATISGNTVYANSTGIQAGTSAVNNNTAYGNVNIGLILLSYTTASGNTAYANKYGLVADGISAAGNVLYNNTITGLLMYNGLVSGNRVYSNPIGVQVGYNYSNNTGYWGGPGSGTLANNLIYANTAQGIWAYGNGLNILSNTVYALSGDAVDVVGGAVNITLQNNVLDAAAGYDLLVSSDSQSGFSSDFNDLYATGTGQVGFWQNVAYPHLADWYRALGFDAHSLSADPQFVNPAGADGILGYSGGTDHGADDNFALKNTSPAIDAGSLTSYWLQEPQGNGGRADLGAFGNSPQAPVGHSQELQVISPSNLQDLSVGTPVNVQWRSFGLTQSNTVALVNMGGPTADNFLADIFQGATYSTSSITHAIDNSLVPNPAPQQVYQTLDYSGGSVGNELSYLLPVPDGTYSISLQFAEFNSISVGTRTFNILLNGNTVATNYDVFKQAGGQYKAVEATFPVTASGGSGIHLELVTTDTTGWPAVLNGLKLTTANPLGIANPKIDLQLSTDGGTTWNPIATALTMDPYGRGSYAWTPTAQQASSNAMVRVVSEDFTSISGTSAPFSVGSGNDYYVSPSGSNANDGRSLATPMQSLVALLAAYPNIGTGATVHLAGGTYTLANNIFLGTSHSGLTIIGPADQSAVLNRSNLATNSYVIQVQNASNVTLQNLTLTGGAGGVYTTTPSGGPGSTGLQVLNCLIYGNTGDGIYVDSYSTSATISGNTVYGHTTSPNYQAIDIEVDSANSIVRGNTAHDASNFAIYSANAPGIQILNNTVFASNFGIYVSGNGSNPATISGNIVYANTTGLQTGTAAVNNNIVYGNANIGLLLGNYTTGSGNTAYGNKYGLIAAGISTTGNVLYNNSIAGLLMYGGLVSNNRVYSNAIGVQVGYNYSNNTGYWGGTGNGILANNLIYANTTQGIWAYGNGLNILNNTVYELAGDAVDVVGGSTNVTLQNNILEAIAGYDIYVASNSQSGFVSDYNDLFRGTNPDPRAQTGFWNSAAQTTLANWQAATSQDGHSIAADPKWVDPAGADNVLGYNTVTSYNGGADDNFFLGHNSPAIDMGNSWSASATDIEGYTRADDPGTPNTGSPNYVEANLGSSSFSAGGTGKGWRYAYPTYWTLALPFAFPFYGTSYSSVYVGNEGAIQFGGVNALTLANSDSALSQYPMIAPLWTTLRTDLTGNDIFVDTSTAGQVTIRWAATNTKDNSPVNFSVTLFSNGNIQFDYGSGNTNLTPTIGISSGTTTVSGSYLLSSYDKQTTLTNAASLKYSFQPGIVDLGAYEFRGSSNTTVPPTIVSTNPPGIQSNGTASYVSQIQVTFSRAINDIDANAPANYQLLGSGPDGLFNTADDIRYTIAPVYVGNSSVVTLQVVGATTTSGTALPWNGQLPNGLYQLTVDSNPSGTGIHDLSGLKLDGDNNGTEGGNYVRTFTVANAGAITGKVFNDANNNGLLDTSETGIAGVTVYIDANHDGIFDAGDVSVVTDSNGIYTFNNLAAGTYMVREVPPAGYAETAPLGYGASVTVSGAQNAGPIFGDVLISSVTMNVTYFQTLSRNFGRPGTFATGDLNGDGTVDQADLLLMTRNFGHTLGAGISGRVFTDVNNNGVLDATEVGLAGVTVYIDANNNGKLDAGEMSTVTDSNGMYTFSGLSAGAYTIRELRPAGYAQSAPLGYSGTANVISGQTVTGPAFGDVPLSSVTMNLAYFTTLTRNFGKPGTFATGDVNGDGIVNLADLMIVTRNFGLALASISSPAVTAASTSASIAAATPAARSVTRRIATPPSISTPIIQADQAEHLQKRRRHKP